LSVWQAIPSILAAVIAVPGAFLAWAAFRRSARVEDAKSSADASAVGLQFMKEALDRQEATILRQEGLIGELRGELNTCERDRDRQNDRIAELETKIQ
jgi:hypothetical protein